MSEATRERELEDKELTWGLVHRLQEQRDEYLAQLEEANEKLAALAVDKDADMQKARGDCYRDELRKLFPELGDGRQGLARKIRRIVSGAESEIR